MTEALAKAIGDVMRAVVRDVVRQIVVRVMDDTAPWAWAAPSPLARHRHHPVEDWRTGPRRRRQPRKNP